MIHGPTDMAIRAEISNGLFKLLDEPLPFSGRRALIPIFATVPNATTTIVASVRVTGPHRLLGIRFSHDIVNNVGSNVMFVISQNTLTTDVAFAGDEALGGAHPLDATYFPNSIPQRIGFNRLMPKTFCFYKARLSNGSGSSRFYSILFELQMVGTRP